MRPTVWYLKLTESYQTKKKKKKKKNKSETNSDGYEIKTDQSSNFNVVWDNFLNRIFCDKPHENLFSCFYIDLYIFFMPCSTNTCILISYTMCTQHMYSLLWKKFVLLHHSIRGRSRKKEWKRLFTFHVAFSGWTHSHDIFVVS